MTDISANYLMLKGELYEHCKNYNELIQFAINKLNLKQNVLNLTKHL